MNLKRWLGAAQRFLPPAANGDLVLAYHLVGAGTASPVDVTLEQFQRQLDVLERDFEFKTLAQALGADARPRKPRVVLTFDDAYANFADVVWPILKARGIPAVLYAPVGFVRGTSPPPLTGAAMPACSFAQLRELATAGIEIGSHGVTHVNLRKANDATLARELADSRAELERELGRPVRSFCYPQAKLDKRVEHAAARHYDNAVAAGGRRYVGGNRFRIPRFPVRRDEPRFDAMVQSRLWLSEAIASGVRQWRR